ncbi:hypothetical protein MA4S0206_1962 [Mycobacteroides abscessus 4S-0206]|nr:hypothetical protein MA4S0206_1962 [Mycobacteroides abscessus 4S-0206]
MPPPGSSIRLDNASVCTGSSSGFAEAVPADATVIASTQRYDATPKTVLITAGA